MIAARNANIREGMCEKTNLVPRAFCRPIYNFAVESPMKDDEDEMMGVERGGVGHGLVGPGALTNYGESGVATRPPERPGNLGRATRLSCSSKTIISSRQRYALSAMGRQDDDDRRTCVLTC